MTSWRNTAIMSGNAGSSEDKAVKKKMKLYIITGTCGAGKSTMKDRLAEMLDPDRYACIDSDETGLNWWDYAGTDRESQYGADTLTEAFRKAGGKDLVFVTCMVPQDYMTTDQFAFANVRVGILELSVLLLQNVQKDFLVFFFWDSL